MRILLFACATVFVMVQPLTALRAQDTGERTFEFEGYVLSDSLEYSAESIDYFFDKREVILNTNASIRYLGRMLKSNTITYYQDHEFMEAQGKQDSTGVLVETPKFTDTSGETLDGTEIKYNLRTQEGIVLKGRTAYDNGFMTAETIKRASDDTLFVSDGTYTTCDRSHPHFYFRGEKMKFIINNKIIIKPIIAYVSDIPVLWFPFYVFPIAKGRQSGFLTPRYGASRQDGRYFSNIGYYFAPSDYYDYKVAGTLRERNGWLINNWFGYSKQYVLSGSVYGSFEDEKRQGTRQWKLSGSHRHTVSQTLSLTGNINMQSSEFSRNNSPNLYQRLNRNMNSSLRVSKKWNKSGNSLIAYVNQVKNLDTKQTTTIAPNISFTMPKKLIFGTEKSKEKLRKYTQKIFESEESAQSRWYESLYYTFNTDFKNTERDATRLESIRNMDISTSLSSSNKLMGWLTANPSVSFDESFEASNDSVGYKRNDNISAGLSLNTKVYGTFKPSLGRLVGLRHVISPSVSYRFGKRREHEGTGADALYRFDLNDIDRGRISSMNISFRNLFQAKTVDGDKENSFDLFTLDFSTAVDFEKEKRPVSPLRTTLDIKPLGTVKVRLTSSHTLYDDKDTFKPFSPYLDDLSVTTDVGLSEKNLGFMGRSSRVNANKDLDRDMFDTDIDEPRDEVTGDTSSGSPFKLRFSHFYKVSRAGKIAPGTYKYKETHTIKPALSFSVSKYFSIQYNMYYDIKNKTLNQHQVILKRDLHCWQANLSWIPSGIREGFYLNIFIKELPDVKIEKRRGVSRFSG